MTELKLPLALWFMDAEPAETFSPVAESCPFCATLTARFLEAQELWEKAALTPREREVLRLVTRGLSNRQIARTLGIAEKTVKNHLYAIFAKLGVSDRTQAALLAVSASASG